MVPSYFSLCSFTVLVVLGMSGLAADAAAGNGNVEKIKRCVRAAERDPGEFSVKLVECFENIPALALFDASKFADAKRPELAEHVRDLARSTLLSRLWRLGPREKKQVVARLAAESPLDNEVIEALSGFSEGQRALYQLMTAAGAQNAGAIAAQLGRAIPATEIAKILGPGADAKLHSLIWDTFLAQRGTSQKVALGAIANSDVYAARFVAFVEDTLRRGDKLDNDDFWILGSNRAFSTGSPMESLTRWASTKSTYQERFQIALFSLLHAVVTPTSRTWDAVDKSPQLSLAYKTLLAGSGAARKPALAYLAANIDQPNQQLRSWLTQTLNDPDDALALAALALTLRHAGDTSTRRAVAEWLIKASQRTTPADIPVSWVQVGKWLEVQTKQDFGFAKAGSHHLFACRFDAVQESARASNLKLVGGPALARYEEEQKKMKAAVEERQRAEVAAKQAEEVAAREAFRSAIAKMKLFFADRGSLMAR